MHDIGRLGNMVVCTSNAMEMAIRCGGIAVLPPIPRSMHLSIASVGMSFDFSSLPHKSANCSHMTSGCRDFFFADMPKTSLGLSKYHQDPVTFPVLASCFHKYLSFRSASCFLNLDQSLVVHIRNGDVYDTIKNRNRYGQQALCSLLGAMLHQTWEKIYVISEIQNPKEHRSGPLIQFLHAIKDVFPIPIVFFPGSFPIHFNVRMCAVNLYIAYTSLNYINHYLPRLRTLYDPLSASCPTFPPGYGWLDQRANVTVYHMSKRSVNWGEDQWMDNTTNWMKMMLSPCVRYEACSASGG